MNSKEERAARREEKRAQRAMRAKVRSTSREREHQYRLRQDADVDVTKHDSGRMSGAGVQAFADSLFVDWAMDWSQRSDGDYQVTATGGSVADATTYRYVTHSKPSSARAAFSEGERLYRAKIRAVKELEAQQRRGEEKKGGSEGGLGAG